MDIASLWTAGANRRNINSQGTIIIVHTIFVPNEYNSNYYLEVKSTLCKHLK